MSKNPVKSARTIIIVIIALLLLISIYTIVFQYVFNPARHSDKAHYQQELKEMEKLVTYRPNIDRRQVEQMAAELDDANAAKHFFTAWLACSDFSPEEHPFSKLYYEEVEISAILPDLKNEVSKHEHVFRMIEQGLNQPSLDLRKYDSFKIGGGGFHRMFGDLAQLLVARAAVLEEGKDLTGAAKAYLDLLDFVRLISDSGELVNMIIASGVERKTLDHLDQFVERAEDVGILQKLNKDLISFAQSRPSLHDIMKKDLDQTLKRLEADCNPERALYISTLPDDPLLFNYVMDAGRRTFGYFCGMFLVQRQVRKFEKYSREMLALFSKPHPEIIKALKRDIDFTKPHALRDAFDDEGVFVEILAPALYRSMFDIMKAEADRRTAVVRTALRLHRLQYGNYPEDLEELQGVPKEMILDPYTSTSLIYHKTGETYLLYSVGPDLDDDGGKPAKYPYLPGNDGDIVPYDCETPQV